ncbi:MAG TPA: penicillin-binding protein 1B [Thioploca sp.]|nr:MAG: penicillin-binding protein 1B [Gammaproteobacteria bacterium]HDN27064.1 penicillin-binding protein 1B [Thioploca sp.]
MTHTRNRKAPYNHRRRRKRPPLPPPRRRMGFRFRWRWLALILVLSFLGYYVILLDIKVREQFEGKRWALPARVYASPLELYTGMRMTPKTLAQELKAIGYQKTYQLDEPGQYRLRKKNDFLITTRAFGFWDKTDPSRRVQVRFADNEVKYINQLQPARKRLSLLRLEPQLIGKIYPVHREDRILVRLAEVPQTLNHALIAMEDRRFFEHWGISIRGMVRAFMANLKAGKWVQGGSTITQQLIKNFYLSPERTFKRKINEAIMALLLEWHYSKEQILEAYLNEVYLGQDGNHAIHGMGMAARFYFNRPLKELKLPQLALLVGLIRGASIYNPRKHPERGLERRNLVLDTMVEQGKITFTEATFAKAVPLGITKKATESQFPYPAFIGVVRHQLRQDYREEDLRSEGLRIFTTLDPVIQKLGEKAMIEGIKKLEKKYRQTRDKALRKKYRKARNLQGAMIVTGSENGEVLALVNGRKPHYAGFNRPLNAKRPIGSLVKVAVYLTALEKSHTYNLTSILDGSPYEWINYDTGEIWNPKNFDRRVHDDIPLYQALAKSYNVATVRLGMELGLNQFHNTLRRLGIKREFKKMYPAMLLGSLSLSPLEVAQMYQTIASGGFRIPVRTIREVLDHQGKPLQRYPLSVEQSFDAAPVFLLNYALQQALRNGTGRKVAKTLPPKMVLAGKTGTSNDLRDSWFAGFSSELLAVTWVGRDDNKDMGLTGGGGAMVIWGDFIKAFRSKSIAPVVPSSIRWRLVKTEHGTERIPFIINQ